MSQFYFTNSSASNTTRSPSPPPTDPDPESDNDLDIDNLPYPLALPRTDFLTPQFSAPHYLSTLTNRHQTLEDLRSDLRERSSLLSKELLDLVNENYELFLGLGEGLRGGKEDVEGVRVGLLGFRRGVEEVRKGVEGRRGEVEGMVEERRRVCGEVGVGRRLLEIDSRVSELEEKLLVGSLGRGVNGDGEEIWSDSDDDDDDSERDAEEIEGADYGPGIRKIEGLVRDFKKVEGLAKTLEMHPFVVGMGHRLLRVRNTLLLDLGTVLRQAKKGGKGAGGRVVRILGIYREMGESEEAIKALRNIKEYTA